MILQILHFYVPNMIQLILIKLVWVLIVALYITYVVYI